ncbi:unnamed protein product [Sphagnum jensenii]|uniref:Uncharacterized protein n=1 Tax=Sphagnum jensenii TaxID=128206 RepID=A0ABP0VIB3_9BRYO
MNGVEVDLSDPTTWKYYLNISGQYHSTDTVMTIVSLDTKTVVNFTTAMLASSPRTQAAYVIDSSYYTALCAVYPTQVDLIKSIIYPVDIYQAIAASDFTLIGWGNGYLEAGEQDAILYELNRHIAYVSTKWYGAYFSYEAYYVWAFWGMFWYSLSTTIFTARLKYLHTASANSFHIWSYLQSNGIGDYSDILTQEQALFLYRNIDYIKQNGGKQSNLVLLVNKLLNSLNVGLVGKTIYMNTATNAAICDWVPEFVSTIIPTINSQSLTIVPPETMTDINLELVGSGLDISSAADYVARQQTTISRTPLNTLPTKLVEIQKLGADQKYGGVLITFILDTLVSMIVTGRYAPVVDITDPTTKISISLSGKDALALYYYAVQRVTRNTVIDLPTIYMPSAAFQYNLTPSSIPESFVYKGYVYPTRSYLDVNFLLTGLTYPTETITDPDVFGDLVANLFSVLIGYIRYSRTEANAISLNMFLSYCQDYILQTTPYTIALSSATTYTAWASGLGLTSLLAQLDAMADYTDPYTALATAIATALVPETNPIYAMYAYTSNDTDNIYDRIKSLFEQLCSYNIAFLDTNRTNTWWFLTERIVYDFPSITDQTTIAQIPMMPPGPLSLFDTLEINDQISQKDFNAITTDTVTIDIEEVGDTIHFTQTDVLPHQLATALTDTSMGNTDTITIAFTDLLQAGLLSVTTTGVD